MSNSESLQIAKHFLGKKVKVKIDRPLGSKHPKYDFIYKVNYGYIEGVKAPDGEYLDVYFLGVKFPVKDVEGECVAIVHRLDDDDDKLVVVADNLKLSDNEIKKQINFQEKWFKSEILRK